ncbi:MAG: 2,3-bisphosphoglycerate-independent phosphoglycerate mutase, partial [Deltaproteobacteria bacterium]|nr:2,3-bisphosphoglycerate-independent phosphoglycerate mutase [Deltaproteobacteria bacterium]
MTPRHKVLLVVLDGWGLRRERDNNAIALAGTPALDKLARDMPFAELQTAGLAVGLPEGQMGNSEVGHTNIGAGRVVYQDLVRINRATEAGELGQAPALRDALDQAKREGTALHLLGLCSPGGVHSSLEHLYGLLRAAKAKGLQKVFIHAFTDGRDTPPQSARGYLEGLEQALQEIGCGRVATVSGRYYAMDRDKRWERVKLAYDALVLGAGPRAPSSDAAIRASYEAKVTDEFIVPTVVTTGNGEPVARIKDGDVCLFFNFRADRARELTQALAFPAFKEFDRGGLRVGRYVCMTQYDETFEGLPVAFPPEQPRDIFPEVLAGRGLKQFRTAET